MLSSISPLLKRALNASARESNEITPKPEKLQCEVRANAFGKKRLPSGAFTIKFRKTKERTQKGSAKKIFTGRAVRAGMRRKCRKACARKKTRANQNAKNMSRKKQKNISAPSPPMKFLRTGKKCP
ncbi:MAG: hypothetical protein DBX55_05825 [Verrucomicrobia bacterium]|nr:MAG: hypothetical protein DBX55_05825 [Verrucomicrobiota bacterium]